VAVVERLRCGGHGERSGSVEMRGGHHVLFLFLSSQAARAAAGQNFCQEKPAPGPSGNDVGRDLVFDEGDTVTQLQFAFLQPL
jgi:hypothetical protein